MKNHFWAGKNFINYWIVSHQSILTGPHSSTPSRPRTLHAISLFSAIRRLWFWSFASLPSHSADVNTQINKIRLSKVSERISIFVSSSSTKGWMIEQSTKNAVAERTRQTAVKCSQVSQANIGLPHHENGIQKSAQKASELRRQKKKRKIFTRSCVEFFFSFYFSSSARAMKIARQKTFHGLVKQSRLRFDLSTAAPGSSIFTFH